MARGCRPDRDDGMLTILAIFSFVYFATCFAFGLSWAFYEIGYASGVRRGSSRLAMMRRDAADLEARLRLERSRK